MSAGADNRIRRVRAQRQQRATKLRSPRCSERSRLSRREQHALPTGVPLSPANSRAGFAPTLVTFLLERPVEKREQPPCCSCPPIPQMPGSCREEESQFSLGMAVVHGFHKVKASGM